MASKGKHKLWKNEDMVAAMTAEDKNELTVCNTSSFVPRKMLYDCVKKRVLHGTRPRRGLLKRKRACVTTCNSYIWQNVDFL